MFRVEVAPTWVVVSEYRLILRLEATHGYLDKADFMEECSD